MFTLAHLSDWHTTSLEGLRLRDLVNKRALGWLSWRQRRRHAHRPEVLRALFKDLKRQAPDQVAVTGDLTNVALPREFESAAEFLAELGPPTWISVVPGNHDAYVSIGSEQSWDHWAEYMASDDAIEDGEDADVLAAPLRAPAAEDFPTVRVRGPLALVGVCSAQPTPLGQASGQVGPEQLTRLAAKLAELRTRELCRVILIHHPVTDEGYAPRRRLVDSRALRSVLHDVGADLVLHGHGHRTQHASIPGPERPIPVVGVRSASEVGTSERRRAQYHLFRIERAAAGADGPRFRFALQTRGYDAASGGFADEGERSL